MMTTTTHGGRTGRRRRRRTHTDAIRDPSEDTSDTAPPVGEGSLPLEMRVERTGGGGATTSGEGKKSASARKVSVEVQRALARRVLEAQRGWLSSKESAALGELETRGEALQSDPELVGVIPEAYMRVRWLLGLLILQSTSSLVLSQYEDLIKENIVVTLFLTMLVGAGGNAGNQSAIHVIRGLATGEMDDSPECLRKTLSEQFQVGLLLGTALSTAGFVRVLLTSPEGTSDLVGPLAIATSLFAIVTTSTCVGTVLPFLLMKFKQDPANAGTTVQVIMDVSGVIITCTVASFIFSHAQEWGILV
jgi:cation transporter-like permease